MQVSSAAARPLPVRPYTAPAQSEAPVAPAFSGERAAAHFVHGFGAQAVDAVRGLFEHPVQALAWSAAIGGVLALAPALGIASAATAGVVVTLGFAAWGAWGMFQGYQAYRGHRAAGEDEAAEQDFEVMGRGAFDVGLALAPMALEALGRRLRPAPVEAGVRPEVPKAPEEVVKPRPRPVTRKVVETTPKPVARRVVKATAKPLARKVVKTTAKPVARKVVRTTAKPVARKVRTTTAKPVAKKATTTPKPVPTAVETTKWVAAKADRLRELAFLDFREGHQTQGVAYQQAAMGLDDLAGLMKKVDGQLKRGSMTAQQAAVRIAKLRVEFAQALKVARQLKL